MLGYIRVFSSFEHIALTLLLLFCSFIAQAAEDEQYEIIKVKDNVYRFTAGHYHSVFMVTEEGLILTDPLSDDAARYLKQELQQRFDVPVRYLIYSHSHVDHVLGGFELVNDDVTVVAQDYAAEDIRLTKAPTALPNLTFKNDLTVSLGNSHVELHYHGPNNGHGSVSMRFMPANVMFVVDWIVLGRVPYRTLPGYDINGMMRSTREILAAEPFDVFVGGHSKIGERKDVERYLSYLETLYAAVRDGMLQGKKLEELQDEIQLTEFSDLLMYDEWFPENIAAVFNYLNTMAYFESRPDIPHKQE